MLTVLAMLVTGPADYLTQWGRDRLRVFLVGLQVWASLASPLGQVLIPALILYHRLNKRLQPGKLPN